jgi:hypothetical protein
MDGRFLDAAKKTRDSIAAKTGELTQAASGTGDKMRDLMASTGEHLADATAEMKQLTVGKLEEALADFNAALPLLRKAGYVLDGVKVKLGLTPEVSADFACESLVSDEELDAMLADHAQRKVTTLMLKTLRQASRLQSKLTFKGMRPGGLRFYLGLVPRVAVKFHPVRDQGEGIGG